MTAEFIASTQYNDLTGTAAFDGHDGPGVHELAAMSEVPADYFPIGFRLYRLDPDEDGFLPFRIIAVKKSETGDSMEEIAKAEKMTGTTVTVYSFPMPRFGRNATLGTATLATGGLQTQLTDSADEGLHTSV